MTWTPHLFIKKAQEKGLNRESVASAKKEYERLMEKGLPPLLTLGHLSYYTKTNYWYLNRIVSRKFEGAYRTFQIKKRSGGSRNINVPDKDLMKVQKWIDRNILSRILAGPHSFAYEKGKKILDCVSRHVGSKWLIKIDIRNFFESITEKQIYQVFTDIGYNNLISFELARICTKVLENAQKYDDKRWKNTKQSNYNISCYKNEKLGHLPQGAPTSPKLSNLVVKNMDALIAKVANEQGFIYTRYADDITLSTIEKYHRKKACSILNRIENILETCGFKSNSNKIKIIGPGLNKVILGLNISNDRVHITKKLKRKIECHIFHCIDKGPNNHARKRGFKTIIGLKNYLLGILRYVKDVDIKYYEKIKLQFDQIKWPF